MLLLNIITLSCNFFTDVLNLTVDTQYLDFLQTYNKTFSHNSYHTYLENKEFIENHNKESKSYTLEVNKFTDIQLTDSYKFITKSDCNNCFTEQQNNENIPDSVDWRSHGAVTNVKNQEDCGSCWAFSTTGSIEGILAIHIDSIFNHKIYNLSEQQLVDCSRENKGCQGGIMDKGFEYVINNGLCSENSYPYTAHNGLCKSTSCNKLANINSYSDVISNNEKALKHAVAQQPVSVAIQANISSFRFYKNGVYSDPDCGTDLDHGVLVVGYGSDKESSLDYWIVKNSWSASWGENGYIRILRNYNKSQSGMCGIAMQPSFPTI